jgi:GT2 family glycosyltransferase
LPKTAVVILNWNGREFLEKFLPPLLQFSSNVAEIIIADNASTDTSIEYIEQNFPSIRIIKNRENGGFAKGYNDALKQVDAEFYILLNSDIEVTENWIPPVIKMMEKDPKIAACQPKIRSYHNPEFFEYAGAAGGFIDKFGYPFCRGRIFQSIENDHGQYDQDVEIFWATGACLFVRSDIYHKFDGLDSDFFAHMEEIDFCWRVKNSGYKIAVCHESTVYHVGGGTLPKRSAFKTYLNIRNNIIMLYKNLPANKLFAVLFVRSFLDMIASFKFLVDGGWKDFLAVFRAYLSFYRRFSKHRPKRKKIDQKKVPHIYKGNIVFKHYLGRVKRFSDLDANRFT